MAFDFVLSDRLVFPIVIGKLVFTVGHTVGQKDRLTPGVLWDKAGLKDKHSS